MEPPRKMLLNGVRSLGLAGLAGLVLGIGLAVVGQLKEPVFITETWSYVPSEQWWMHGAMVAVTLMLLVAAFDFALLAAVLLLRHGMLIGSVGAGLALMGMAMLLLALTVDSLDTGQRVMFGLMSPALAGFGMLMVRADFNRPRRG